MSLRLVRRPKSPNWVIRGTIRGIRVEESAGTNDKKIAEEIRAKREAELFAESVYGRRATATFAQASLSYLEQGGSKRFLNPIISHFASTPLARIDQDVIDRGARKLLPRCLGFDPRAAVLRAGVGGADACCQTRMVRQADHRASKDAAWPQSLDHARRKQSPDRCLRRPFSAAGDVPDLYRRARRRGAVG